MYMTILSVYCSCLPGENLLQGIADQEFYMNLKIWHLLVFAAAILLLIVVLLPNRREEGVLLARSGKVPAAAELLEPLIQKNPKDYKAVIALADAYNAINESGKAGKLFEDYLRNGGADNGIRQKLLDMYIQNYQYSRAVSLLKQESEPDLEQLIELSVRMGNLTDALLYSRELLMQTEDKAEKLRIMREIETYERWQLNMRGVAQSLEELVQLEDTLENNLQALDFFIWKNNLPKMEFYAQKVMKFPELTLAEWRVLRTTWIKLRNINYALLAAEKIVSMPKAEYTDWADYMTLLEWAGKTRKLQAVVAQLLERYPQNSDLYYKELNLLPVGGSNLKRAEIEVKLYELTTDPGLILDAARIYKQNQKGSRLKQIYAEILQDKKFIASVQDNLAAAMLLVEAYWAEGKRDKARAEFENVYSALHKLKDSRADQSIFYSAIDFARVSGQKLAEADLSLSLYRLTGEVQLLKTAVAVYQATGRTAEFMALSRKLLAAGNISPGEELGILRVYLELGMKDDAAKLAERIYANVLGQETPENADPYWVALDAADALGNTAVKAKILEKFYTINPDSELLREAAGILVAAGKVGEAIILYQRLEDGGELEAYDTAELMTLYRKVGMKKKLAALALKSLTAALSREELSKEDDLYYSLLDVLPELGYEREAEELLTKYARGGDIEAEIMLARLTRDSGKLAQARATLEGILRESKISVEEREQAELLLAGIIADEFYAQQDTAEQLKLLNSQVELIRQAISAQRRAALKLTGQDRIAGERLSDSFTLLLIRRDFLLKDYAGVDHLITQLLAPDEGIYLELASLYYNAGEDESARRYFSKIKDISNFDSGQYVQLGFLYAAFKEYKRALAAYKKADRLTNGLDKNVRVSLAEVYGALGEKKEQYRIVDFYTTFLKSKTQDWLRAADARLGHGDYLGEYHILKKAVKAKPDSALLLARMVSRLVALGQRAKAIEYAKRLNGLKVRRDVESLLTVGYSLLDIGQVKEAGRMFQAASALETGNDEVFLALARYYTAAFKYPKAHRLYKEYLEKKVDGRVWYEYAVLKQAAGFVGAREAFLNAEHLLLNGKQTSTDMSLLSSLNSYLNRRGKALEYAEYARKMDQDNIEYTFNLAELYNSYNYPEYGKKIAQSAEENGFESARKRALIAEAEMLSRRFSKSIAELDKVLELQPDNGASQLTKGYAEIELGERLKGADSLLRAEALESAGRISAEAGNVGSENILAGILLPELGN